MLFASGDQVQQSVAGSTFLQPSFAPTLHDPNASLNKSYNLHQYAPPELILQDEDSDEDEGEASDDGSGQNQNSSAQRRRAEKSVPQYAANEIGDSTFTIGAESPYKANDDAAFA